MELKLPLTYKAHYEGAFGLNWKERYFVEDANGRIIAAEISKSVAEMFVRAVNAEEAHRKLVSKLREYWDDEQVDGSQTDIALRASEKALGMGGSEL